jgi:hypothetical protein
LFRGVRKRHTGVAKREIGKWRANSPGESVPSGLLHGPGRFVFQKEELGALLSLAGRPKKLRGSASGKTGGGKTRSTKKQRRKPRWL